MQDTLPMRHRDIFGRNPAKRAELLDLRGRCGWSMPRLGRHFGCDYSTVRYNLARFAPHLLGLKNTIIQRRRPTAAQMRRHRKQRLSLEVVGPTTCVALMLPPPAPHPSLKYRDLIEDECVRVNPGKSYAEYRRESRKRTKPLKDARLAVLKVEKAERDARRGHKLMSKAPFF